MPHPSPQFMVLHPQSAPSSSPRLPGSQPLGPSVAASVSGLSPRAACSFWSTLYVTSPARPWVRLGTGHTEQQLSHSRCWTNTCASGPKG